MTGKRRILHLIDTGGLGGAETVFAQVATGLDRLGFESTAVIGRDAWLATRLRSGGLEPRLLPAKGSVNLDYLHRLIQIVRAERPGLLLTHLLGPAVYGSMAGIWTRTPVVAVLHGQSDLSDGERLRAVKAAIIRHGTRRVVFVSEQLQSDVAPCLGLKAGSCEVIPNGVDVASISRADPAPIRLELDLRDRVFLFGAVGNLRKPKAYDVLLRAARLVIEQQPHVRLVIAGDTSGPLHRDLVSLRASLGLSDTVHFLGPRNDIPALLKALDAFVLSSTTEGFSIAVCEAMAAGVPIIATRSGGPQQILDGGQCGHLVAPGDPAALADGMLKLACSDAERRHYVNAARRRVERLYSVDAMLRRYASLASGA